MIGKNSTLKTTLWLQFPDGNRLECKVDRLLPLVSTLRAQYCEARGGCNGYMRLTFEGLELRDRDTCETLQLEDNDLIDVFITRVGDGP
ncbi:hypothetical protein KR018_005643 [Drosophila ironensis]|nr:hypothetical protein KR018_005643 [Drosophila ironensis]